MNKSPSLSLAGTWQPVDSSYLIKDKNYGGLAGTTYGHLTLGGRDGMVISGWGWSGGFGDQATLTSPEQVHIAVLAPQADGTLKLATPDYLKSDVTNGANAVAIADFNGDGRDDIFLPAHNESPFKAEPSTLYLSNAQGGFDKTTLSDSVMAHDAELVFPNQVPTVMTATFNPGDKNPIYTSKDGTFQESIPAILSSIFHQSITYGNFGLNGGAAIAMGDVFSEDPSDNAKIKVYAFANGDVTSATPLATITPYLSLKYPDLTSIYGKGITHTYRILTDDFNHDGKADLMAGESMWTSSNIFPSVLQLLQNDGAGNFIDKTDALGSAVGENNQELDYQPQMLDLDHSGINSYLMASPPVANLVDGKLVFDNSRVSNYLLLNDGTGRLYAALHDQFADLGNQVIQFLKPLQVNADGSQNFYIGDNIDSVGIPKFVGYQVDDGALNYVAEINVGRWVSPGLWGTKYLLVNVPVRYDATTDFTGDVVVGDRNGSKLMRTWAGDDTFHDTHAGLSAHIDGGLGTNASVYSGKLSAYHIGHNADGSFSVSTPGSASVPQVSDTLVNIARLDFSDASVALGISGHASQAYRIYQAAFDRKPDAAGLGYWIAEIDKGMSLDNVAASFIDSPEFAGQYGGANPSADAFVTKLYTNVLHRAPDQAGHDYWTHAIDSGASRAALLAQFSEGPENQAQVIGSIQDGIAFTQWGG